MIHSIQNADGTVSIIQVDPNNQIITLPDGTTAQVQGVATVSILHISRVLRNSSNSLFVAYRLHLLQLHTTDNTNQMHTVQSIEQNGHNNTNENNMTTVDLTEATLGQDGQLIITGEDGHGKTIV